jgi:hypothetical protein
MSHWMQQLESIDRDLLSQYFTSDFPLGPIDAGIVSHDEISKLLTERDFSRFKREGQSPSVIVGRRGSGKTSYLRRLRHQSEHDFFLEISTQNAFNSVVSSITSAASDSVTVEVLADIWDGVFWNLLIWQLVKKGRPTIGFQQARAHIRELGIGSCADVSGVMDRLGGIFSDQVSSYGNFATQRIRDKLCPGGFDTLKKWALEDLVETGQHATVVLDSLDEYPVNTTKFQKALAGLLKAVGQFNSVRSQFQLRLCLPAELYWEFVEKISTNSAKDFSNQRIMQWPVGELEIMAARRMSIFLWLYQPKLYAALSSNHLETKTEAEEYWHHIFPATLTNLNGGSEQTLKYILRHTQLLPRQLLLYLSEIFRRQELQIQLEPNGPFVTGAAVIRAIFDVEHNVCSAVYGVYKSRYANAQEVCQCVLPSLPRVFTNDQLQKVCDGLARDLGSTSKALTVQAVRRMLAEIGAIGKFVRHANGYLEGRFEYALAGKLPIGLDDKMCVHPVFMRVCDVQKAERYSDPVFPISSDLT